MTMSDVNSTVQAHAGIVVEDLQVVTAQGAAPIVRGISFAVTPGSILGLVGESGSGKTTAGLALLAHARPGLKIAAGRVSIGGVSMLNLSARELRTMRGREITYVPQDPATALHPGLRLRTQLAECLRNPADATDERLHRLLEDVGLPDPARILSAFPHELSGGQQQRIAIAMAFAPQPQAILMDEPTTALDVTTQTRVLHLVRAMAQQHRTAIVYVSHDLAVVAALADQVAVMYAGEIVEAGTAAQVLERRLHPYTGALLRAVPDPDQALVLKGLSGHAPDPAHRPPGCAFAARCDLAEDACRLAPPADLVAEPGHVVRCRRMGQTAISRPQAMAQPILSQPQAAPLLTLSGLGAWHGRQVLHDIAIDIAGGRCTAVVGESGSGKTTLARCIAGLHAHWTGDIRLNGAPLRPSAGQRSREQLRRIQYVFQNPYASLNPRQTIGQSLLVAGRHLRGSKAISRSEILAALASVGLPHRAADAFPGQLSGGQRQRAAIARGLICQPDLLVCDEITSALDVSIQATIVELLLRLQQQRGLSMLFVAHNIGLVRSIAQDIIVLQAGRIVESGPTQVVLSAPKAKETARLMQDAPRFAAGLQVAPARHIAPMVV
ncbi:ABC transporter ATP-binding protein [Acidisoma silvae]|uniref:ABC transporter ATP-binding protein n=1 Tax=Acidisoma silvae TaxID=2802396 RepID=A0A963YV28_9PROT|nr:ABC transporter ATP-binding protein [Acidisoma silvae]MCB8877549.1 ABC transporter ATP-binding protein [Acidisoma silvae]